MRLSTKAFAITSGLIWAGAILLVGVINLAAPFYGTAFLQLLSSVYPGFDFTRTFPDVLVGTLYGLIDGAVAGFVFAWLYNALARPPRSV
jgi:hypothetical protein